MLYSASLLVLFWCKYLKPIYKYYNQVQESVELMISQISRLLSVCPKFNKISFFWTSYMQISFQTHTEHGCLSAVRLFRQTWTHC